MKMQGMRQFNTCKISAPIDHWPDTVEILDSLVVFSGFGS